LATVKPWAGIQAPNQYAFAYGQEISRAYIFSFVYCYHNHNSEYYLRIWKFNIKWIFRYNSNSVGAHIEISCMAPGTTVLSKTSSTIVVSNNALISNTVTGILYPFG